MVDQVFSTGTGRFAVLRISNPPINALSVGVRRRLIRDLGQVDQDPQIDAVLLAGSDGAFATSVPIREIETGIEGPSLADLCRRIEEMTKPVVACLEGHVAGAGLELALAAHGRAADPRARLGFPDLHIGLGPTGGTTQRLPRLVGADAALRLLIGAQPHPARAPLGRAMVDRLAEARPVFEEAGALAEHLFATGLWCRTRDRIEGLEDAQAYQAAVARWREAVQGPGKLLEQRLVEAVAAAQIMPFDSGLALEQAGFAELHAGARSRGLRRARFAEQRCTRITGRTSDQPVAFAMYPATASTGRIAGAAAVFGVPAVIADEKEMQVTQVVGAVHRQLDSHAAIRNLPEARLAVLRDRVVAADSVSAIAGASLVFVPGTGGRDEIAARLEAVAPHLADHAVVLCLADGLDCGQVAPPSLAGRVMGLTLADRDFPARLAEVSVSDGTADPALAVAQAGLRRIGRVLVRSPAGFPSVTSTLFDAMMAAADRLVRAGVHPVQIDGALTAAGFARGPYALLRQIDSAAYLRRLDAIGGAGRLSAMMLREGVMPPADGLSNGILDGLVLGLRTGDPWSPPRAVITSAMVLALVNAGCRLIETGAVARPMQIDVTMLHGWGYPRITGGPMSEADQMGIFRLVQLARRLEPLDAGLWAAHPILQELQRSGRRFYDLDTGARASRAA